MLMRGGALGVCRERKDQQEVLQYSLTVFCRESAGLRLTLSPGDSAPGQRSCHLSGDQVVRELL